MMRVQHQAGDSGFTRQFALATNDNRLATMTTGDTTYDYVYDASGNLARENTSRHFEWDYADRMRVFRIQTDGSEPSRHAHYLYDASGMRVKKLVRKQGGQVEVRVYIDGVFEHQRLIQGSVAQENNTLHVMDDQSRIALVRVGDPLPDETAPAVQYHLGDHLGSNTLVIDDTAVVVNREEYSPYGETSFGSFARKRYRFTGKERDEESGLSYHGARYYAPGLARWVSTDPAGMQDGLHLYRYVHNNPLRLIDSNGLQGSEGKVLALGHSKGTLYGMEVPLKEYNLNAAAMNTGLAPVDIGSLSSFKEGTFHALSQQPQGFLASATAVQEALEGQHGIRAIHINLQGVSLSAKTHTAAELRSLVTALATGNNDKVDIHFLHPNGALSTVRKGTSIVEGAPLPEPIARHLPPSFAPVPRGGPGQGGDAGSRKSPTPDSSPPSISGSRRLDRVLRGGARVGRVVGVVGNVAGAASESLQIVARESPELLPEGITVQLTRTEIGGLFLTVPTGYSVQNQDGKVIYRDKSGSEVSREEAMRATSLRGPSLFGGPPIKS